LALRILGPRQDLHLMKKGRMGVLWMNVEEITFAHIPTVYLLWTSPKLGEEGLRKLQFDCVSMLAGCLHGKTPEEEGFLIHQLIKLKRHDNLYNISEGTIQTQPLERGLLSQAQVVLHLPAKIAPGLYTLELIAFKEGESALLRSYPLKVQLAGLPGLLGDLSSRSGLLYGVLAVFIATLAGLGMGIFFSSKGGH
jgi:Putative transmembrane protein (Alph_Pro_TM)